MSQESRDARIAKFEASQTFADKIKALEATKPMPDQFASPDEHEEALGQWMQTRGRTIALLRSRGYADPSSSGASEKKLPDAPTRDQFQSQEEFEESLGYWHSHVGRIKGLVARALMDSQADQKQGTPKREPRAATQLAASLISAFHESEYCVDEGGRETILRVDQHSPDLEGIHRQYGVASSAFLTAWNPESRECSMTQNEASQGKLIDEISARGFSYLRGEGRNVERTWREESLLVLGIGQVDAIEIGDRFAQNAILFAGADATPRLVLLR